MKTVLLFLVAAVAIVPLPVRATQSLEVPEAIRLDLYACVRPVYPPPALAERVGGRSTLEIQVDAEGKVSDARVAVSSGRTDLDQSALAGVRKCAFHVVATLGKPADHWFQTQFVWQPGMARRVQDPALLSSTRQAAEEGDPLAQNRLGAWHEHGSYVEHDMAQAAAWYRLAADNGNAIAQNNLGVLYSRGVGVPRSSVKAAYWYEKAAEQGHGWAQANLARAYESGSGGKWDRDIALRWLTASAEGGLAAAQVRLGLLLLARAASDEERVLATAWLARAAQANDPAGLYYLGRSYERGLGNAQDDAQAASLYRKALGRSGGRAETALGALIEAGRTHAEAPDQALALYDTALRARDPAVFYHYGVALEARGDTELAAAMLRHGSGLGDCQAVFRWMEIRMAQDPTFNTSWRRIPRPPTIEMCRQSIEPEPLF